MPLRFNETVTDIGQDTRDRVLKSKIYRAKFDKHAPKGASENDIKAFEKDLRRNPGKYVLDPKEKKVIFDKVDKYEPLDGSYVGGHGKWKDEGENAYFKRDYVTNLLKRMNYNQTKTAEVLDIQRTYLSRMIKELDISREGAETGDK